MKLGAFNSGRMVVGIDQGAPGNNLSCGCLTIAEPDRALASGVRVIASFVYPPERLSVDAVAGTPGTVHVTIRIKDDQDDRRPTGERIVLERDPGSHDWHARLEGPTSTIIDPERSRTPGLALEHLSTFVVDETLRELITGAGFVEAKEE